MSIKETRWLAIPSPCSMLNSEAEGEAAAAASAQNPVHDARDGKVVRRNTLKVAHFLSDFRINGKGGLSCARGQNGSQDTTQAPPFGPASHPSTHPTINRQGASTPTAQSCGTYVMASHYLMQVDGKGTLNRGLPDIPAQVGGKSR